MHHDEFEKGIRDLKGIHLSATERAVLFDRIKGGARPSPYVRVEWFMLIHRRFARALAAFLILFLGGGTTMYAAQGALPGDPLYGVKISVNELILSALARTPEARARLESALAVRRLHEAEALAAQNELSAERRALLEERFRRHATSFAALAREVASSRGKDLATEFNGVMNAHAIILEKVREQVYLADVRNELDALYQTVKSQIASLQEQQ